MKKLISCGWLSVVATLLNHGTSQAEGIYVSGFAGLALPTTQEFSLVPDNGSTYGLISSPGYDVGGAVGLHLTDNLRAEIELSMFRHEANKTIQLFSTSDIFGDTKGLIGLANVWLDLNNESPFTPYVGGGAGFGVVDMNTHDLLSPDFSVFVGNSTGFAFQLGAGIRVDVAPNLVMDLGYRFKSIQNLSFDVPDLGRKTFNQDLDMHVVQLGLTYTFN